MTKLIALALLAATMLALGIFILLFTAKIRYFMLKNIGNGKGLFKFNQYSIDQINSTQTIWSMRFGGLMAFLIGLLMLWMTWRNLK